MYLAVVNTWYLVALKIARYDIKIATWYTTHH